MPMDVDAADAAWESSFETTFKNLYAAIERVQTAINDLGPSPDVYRPREYIILAEQMSELQERKSQVFNAMVKITQVSSGFSNAEDGADYSKYGTV